MSGAGEGVAPQPSSDPSCAPAVQCANVVHVYGEPGAEVVALRGVDLEVARGETVAVVGPSGAGKSTLLWLLAGLTRPTAGRVSVHGRAVGDLSAAELASVRARELGVLLQNPSHNLLPYGSALDNVLFAQRPTRRRPTVKRERARALIDGVGLGGREGARAGGLSGGEQQRLALAVALANGPELLLADEPTSQLDAESARIVIDLLLAARDSLGTTVVVVTHDPQVSSVMDRAVTIRDGRIGAEARAGRELVVVGRDGSLHLPPEAFGVLPPGSLAHVDVTADGVRLHRVDPEEGGR